MILALIVGLLGLGAFIALGSGSGAVAGPLNPDEQGVRLVAGNFSALLLRLVGYLAVLVAVQGAVGFPSLFLW